MKNINDRRKIDIIVYNAMFTNNLKINEPVCKIL